MPETTVDENCDFLFCEYNVRFAGQTEMEPVSPDTPRKEKFPELHFRTGIFCPDAGHIIFPLFPGEDICH